MAIPTCVLKLIECEQILQSGLFVPINAGYLEKLAKHAELITHQDGPEVLGYIFFYCNAPDKRQSYITLLGTSPRARGRGIGYSLVHQVLFISRQRGFNECLLEVRKSNISALEFYKRIGFKIFEDRIDKFLMSMAL